MVRESSIIPRSVKRRYGKYGRLTRKSPEHRKKQWWKDSKIIAEALGIDILNVLDFQTADFGFNSHFFNFENRSFTKWDPPPPKFRVSQKEPGNQRLYD